MIEYFSWSKVRATQPYAAWMMDSVAAGGLMPSTDSNQKDQGAINNIEGTMDICHQDKKYPPWKGQEVDERGLPLPMQPKDQGFEGKWHVSKVTYKELEATLAQIGVTNNELLDEAQKTHMRKLVAYAWGLFDQALRPVDSEPVGLQFKDPKQQPIKMQPYRTNAVKLKLMKGMIDEWIHDGIVEPANSPWGFPVIMVPKPQNKGWRMCVDLRKLNEVISYDSYQSPRNDDALIWFAQKVFRSTLDIRWGYHNLMLTEEAKN